MNADFKSAASANWAMGAAVTCATERKGRLPGHAADAAELATPEVEPPDWVTG